MKRFILVYEGENIFKDQRSFKSKPYANKKAQDYRDYNNACNSSGPNPTVEEIEVVTKEEFLQNQIDDLLTMVEFAQPIVSKHINRYFIESEVGEEFKKLDQWNRKASELSKIKRNLNVIK